jgi:tryptophan synthase alpha chain
MNTGRKIKLMSHLVAGYPTDQIALHAARALVAGGASILEVQLPFSDPSADGPDIQKACTEVLRNGYRTADGLAFIKKLHHEFPDIPIYLMSYGSLVVTPGISNFCKSAADAGVCGLIIPDLPFDHDEGLAGLCIKNNMHAVPVAAPGMDAVRLKKLAHAGFPFIYAALRSGITGSATIIDAQTLSFLADIQSGGSKIFGGFGIANGTQARALADSVHAVVAGSVFVRIISAEADNPELMKTTLMAKVQELTKTA